MNEESPSVAVTRLLLAEPLKVPALREYLTKISGRGNLLLDLESIEPLDAVGLAKLTRRVLGLCAFGPLLCSLIFSLTRLKDAETRVYSIVGDVFGNFISDEFPNATREFLQQRLTECAVGTSMHSLIGDLLRHIGEREKLYSELPILNELRPAHEKLQSYRLAMFKQQREILEQVDKQSVLASLFPKVNLKYGKSVITQIQGKFTEPTHLKQISHFIEIPRSEIRDPVAGILRRDSFLKVGQ